MKGKRFRWRDLRDIPIQVIVHIFFYSVVRLGSMYWIFAFKIYVNSKYCCLLLCIAKLVHINENDFKILWVLVNSVENMPWLFLNKIFAVIYFFLIMKCLSTVLEMMAPLIEKEKKNHHFMQFQIKCLHIECCQKELKRSKYHHWTIFVSGLLPVYTTFIFRFGK